MHEVYPHACAFLINKKSSTPQNEDNRALTTNFPFSKASKTVRHSYQVCSSLPL